MSRPTLEAVAVSSGVHQRLIYLKREKLSRDSRVASWSDLENIMREASENGMHVFWSAIAAEGKSLYQSLKREQPDLTTSDFLGARNIFNEKKSRELKARILEEAEKVLAEGVVTPIVSAPQVPRELAQVA